MLKGFNLIMVLSLLLFWASSARATLGVIRVIIIIKDVSSVTYILRRKTGPFYVYANILGLDQPAYTHGLVRAFLFRQYFLNLGRF